jgi:inhibitor of KinA sporulation pathway (predicted exonuclease)
LAALQEKHVETINDKIKDVEKWISKYDPKKKSSALTASLIEFDVFQQNHFKNHIISEQLKNKNTNSILLSYVNMK